MPSPWTTSCFVATVGGVTLETLKWYVESQKGRQGERMEARVRKTFKYRLMPTPDQAQALERVLSRCRTLYNCALEHRKMWWGRGPGKSATYSQQKAELPDLKAACPDYAEINAQVLQDVILRVERTFQAFFRCV
jgi:Helix-turn-helix domain